MQSILLATTSEFKLEVVRKLFPSDEYTIKTVNCDGCGVPKQSYNCGMNCGKLIMNYAKKLTYPKMFDYYISIENGVERFFSYDDVDYGEVCHVLIEHKGILVKGNGTIDFEIPRDKIKILFRKEKIIIPELNISGYNVTIGDIFNAENPSVDPNNWSNSICKCDVKDQIEEALTDALDKIKEKRRFVLDITSRNKGFFLTSLEASDIKKLTRLMITHCKYDNIEYVAGTESCCTYGLALSTIGNYGFIPVRGNDTARSKSGARIILLQDVIEDGRNIRSICDLLEELGYIIVHCIVLREVTFLRSVAQVNFGRPYTVILQD